MSYACQEPFQHVCCDWTTQVVDKVDKLWSIAIMGRGTKQAENHCNKPTMLIKSGKIWVEISLCGQTISVCVRLHKNKVLAHHNNVGYSYVPASRCMCTDNNVQNSRCRLCAGTRIATSGSKNYARLCCIGCFDSNARWYRIESSRPAKERLDIESAENL